MRLEGLGKSKKFIHLIRSRTRDLPASSIVSTCLHILMYFHMLLGCINFCNTFTF
jgi:hypothetical protein